MGSLTRSAATHRDKNSPSNSEGAVGGEDIGCAKAASVPKNYVTIRKRLIRRQNFLAKAKLLLLFGNLKSLLHGAHNAARKRAVGSFKGQTAFFTNATSTVRYTTLEQQMLSRKNE